MSKIYILLIFLFSMCSSIKRVPNYNEKKLKSCLKKDDIIFDKHTKELNIYMIIFNNNKNLNSIKV